MKNKKSVIILLLILIINMGVMIHFWLGMNTDAVDLEDEQYADEIVSEDEMYTEYLELEYDEYVQGEDELDGNEE